MNNPTFFLNRKTALEMINKEIKLSSTSFYLYQKKGVIQPDSYFKNGKRSWPLYSEETVKNIIEKVKELKIGRRYDGSTIS